ncbi:MAG: hypothetical protein ACOC6I_02540 [Candidatus Bipolaricaulota bacterium]
MLSEVALPKFAESPQGTPWGRIGCFESSNQHSNEDSTWNKIICFGMVQVAIHLLRFNYYPNRFSHLSAWYKIHG